VNVDTHQEDGSHYKKCPPEFQHWNLVVIHGWDYFQAQTIKYIMRYRDKGGSNDLRKARHFIDKMIELAEKHPVRQSVPQPTFAEFLQYVKPSGWVGFVFEGSHKEGFLYTCGRCRTKIHCQEFEPPWAHHNAIECEDIAAKVSEGDATPAYVNQDR
jgi:hypothetical protein